MVGLCDRRAADRPTVVPALRRLMSDSRQNLSEHFTQATLHFVKRQIVPGSVTIWRRRYRHPADPAPLTFSPSLTRMETSLDKNTLAGVSSSAAAAPLAAKAQRTVYSVLGAISFTHLINDMIQS